jgi:hypothetical protein
MAGKKRRARPPWTPFVRATHYDDGTTGEKEVSCGEHEIWVNSRYQVDVTRDFANGFNGTGEKLEGMIWLSIKNRDRTARHDWREFQRIKNELVGEEREAIEIYPAESRLNDEADQFHLYVFPEEIQIPIGYFERRVSEDQPPLGSQRPFELKPPEVRKGKKGS